MTEVIPVIIGGGFQVKAFKVRARAERESQDRQNKYSHHWGVRTERSLMRICILYRRDPYPMLPRALTRTMHQ